MPFGSEGSRWRDLTGESRRRYDGRYATRKGGGRATGGLSHTRPRATCCRSCTDWVSRGAR